MYERHAEQLVKLTALNKRAVQTTDRPPTLRLDQIRQEPAVFQPRSYLGENGVDRFHVSELVRPLKARGRDGQKHLEPILVFAIGNAFYCIDGHHRLAAYARLKRPLSVPVKHFEGTELLSNLVFEFCWSCGDLAGFGGFNTVFERDACDDFGEVVKAA